MVGSLSNSHASAGDPPIARGAGRANARGSVEDRDNRARRRRFLPRC